MTNMVPSPRECGLPEKFAAWREQQQEALRLCRTHEARILVLSAPTGFGKSPVYVAWALLSGEVTAFITESKALQDQLMADYGPIGMVDLRGRDNYPCEARADWSCEDGYAGKCPYKGSVNCPSTAAEFKAAASSLIVTNYSKWTSSRGFGMGLDHVQRVVFDEGHGAPDALSKAMEVTLNANGIQEDLELDLPDPRDAEEMVNWKRWASRAKAIAERKMLDAKAAIRAASYVKPAWVKEYLHLRNLTRKLAVLATCVPADWVVDEVQGGYQFEPVRPGRYVEGALLLRVPKVMFVSATIRPKTMYLCGIPAAMFQLFEFRSDFDAARCPIYYVPTMRVDHRAPSLAPLWVLLDQIIGRRLDRKGLVQSISFARQQEVLAASGFRDYMLVNHRGKAAAPVIRTFKEAAPPAILVSPSIGTGFDFPGRDAEWQFVAKIPFPDGRSKIHKAREADDPEYGAYLAASKFEQIAGRIMRYPGDQGETFIGDEHLQWFLRRAWHLFTPWFKARFKRAETVPAPPPRLEV